MKKFLTTTALLGLLALGACGTTGGGMPSANHINNGEYFVYKYPGGLPHVEDSKPAEWNANTGDQFVYLDRNCRDQMAPQKPSALKSVGTTMLRTAIPTAILAGAGTAKGIAAVTSATKGYGTYGAWSAGGSAAGAGLAGGIDRHLTGNRYTQAGCMNAAVTEAKHMDGALKGIQVVFNADAVNGPPLKRPTNPAPADSGNYTPDPDAEAANTAPHP